MRVLSTSGWSDYQMFDSGNGKRLERYGKYVLVRPDPEALWKPQLPKSKWNRANAIFDKNWKIINMPSTWQIRYKDIEVKARLTPFKHTGIFPEQSINWEYIDTKIRASKTNVKFLNLFGYTGISSLIAAKAGATVTHVDASRPAMNWFSENQELSGLVAAPIRIILDDALKFTAREIKRGNKYEAIIMDPPVYGHDPNGAPWNFQKDFPRLIENVSKILTPEALFVIVNAYAVSNSPTTLENVMRDCLPKSGKFESGELCLQEKPALSVGRSGRLLSTGIYSKWETSPLPDAE